jgi:phosphoglycerate kinase
MKKMTVTDIELRGKRVLCRVDFNVPIKNGVITDDNRIVQALPTIRYIIGEKGKDILFSHLGRVETAEDKAKSSLAPIAVRLSELLEQPVRFVPFTRGKELEDAIAAMKDGEVLMFENTRFEDIEGKKESKNNPELGAYWASLGDVFVNDAFGTAHRAHASNSGIAAHLPAVAGFLMEKELRFIGGAVDNPVRPFVAILGGAKVSDKIGVIENLLQKADKILIGGGMAYTFLKAQGINVGLSICEMDKLDLAKSLLAKGGKKIVLPVDVVVTKEFKNEAPSHVTDYVKGIADDEMGLDVGPKTIRLFEKELKGAKTVVWNGPLGVFEFENFAKGTKALCELLAGMKDAKTIIGGGDSAAAAIQMGYGEKFTHISTGGGASLEYLEGKALPGVESLADAEDCGCGCGCGCDC